MIKYDNNFDEYAYRVSFPTSPTLLKDGFEQGSMVTLNDNGELVKATDALKKAFMVHTSKTAGRDNAARIFSQCSVFCGNFVVTTDQVQTKSGEGGSATPISYNPGDKLTIKDGKLTLAKDDEPVVGYALSKLAIEKNTPFLRVQILP